ncbi:MAG: PEGA domain-containing protein [Vicinamibacterales bacterium]
MELRTDQGLAIRLDTPVLISGGPARARRLALAIHQKSARHRGPFIAVSCDAGGDYWCGSPEGDLLAAGRLASGGTLFIGNIDHATPSFQRELMLVLDLMAECQAQGNRGVGGARVMVGAGDLPARAASGEFNEALFYRLNVIHLRLSWSEKTSTPDIFPRSAGSDGEFESEGIVEQRVAAAHANSSVDDLSAFLPEVVIAATTLPWRKHLTRSLPFAFGIVTACSLAVMASTAGQLSSRHVASAVAPEIVIPQELPGSPTMESVERVPAGGLYRSSLRVESQPAGARVYLNNEDVGLTPLRLDNLVVGSRAVRIEFPGYKTWSTAVMLTAARPAWVLGELLPLPGQPSDEGGATDLVGRSAD